MKIVMLQNFFKPYNKGGAENLVLDMIKNLENQGHDVFVISTKPKDKKKIIKAEEENNNIKTYYLASSVHSLANKKYLFKLFWHISNIYNPKRKNKIIKILNEEKPSVCISHNLIGIGLFVPKITKKLNIRHIHFLHDIQLLHPSGLMIWGQENIINSQLAKKYQTINKYFFKNIYKVISPSNWLMKEHLNRGFFKDAICEIKPLKDASHLPKNSVLKSNILINNSDSNNTQKNNLNSFLFVGQIEKHKGVEFLINTFLEIDNPNIELKIVGDGEYLNKLKKLANNDKRIKFLGKLRKEEVKEEMKNSQALIVPSLCYENSPTVIYEAKENELPVIASAIGGISELIENPNMLFIPNDKEDLKLKLNQFLN